MFLFFLSISENELLSYFFACLFFCSRANLFCVSAKICVENASCFDGYCAFNISLQRVDSLDRWSRRADIRDDVAEILFQSFPQKALMRSSGKGKNVYSLMLSIQHFLCPPRRRQTSKVSWRMVLDRLSWRVTCPNHASSHLLTVARRYSREPTRKLILLRTQLVLCSK